MKRFLPLIILLMLSCERKNCNVAIRQIETNHIIQSLIEEKGLDLLDDYPSKDTLPLCLNLKKTFINTECFIKVKSSLGIVKLPKRSFKNKSELCIEKLFRTRFQNNKFFSIKDSLDLVNQNECVQTLVIPKKIIKKFKTIQYSEKVTIANEYVQFSFPVFSKDNTKAYLEYDHYGKNHKFGNSLYLEKIKGKWAIIYIDGNWDI